MFKELFEEYYMDVYETGAEFSAAEANKWVKKLTKLGINVEKDKYSPKFYILRFRDPVGDIQDKLNKMGFIEKLFLEN